MTAKPKFSCPICSKGFKSLERADACFFRHLKPEGMTVSTKKEEDGLTRLDINSGNRTITFWVDEKELKYLKEVLNATQ